MIRGVLFDFDGVLTVDKTGSQTTIDFLASETRMDQASLWSAMAPFNEDLLKGRTTHAAIWPNFCHRLGRDVDLSLLTAAFRSTRLRADVLSLAIELKSAGYILGIVTDNKYDRMECLRLQFDLDEHFSTIAVSAACGSGKEGREIFELALSEIGLLPSEAVFIDNTQRNLIVAASLGLKTIYFDDELADAQGLSADLESLGVSVGSQVRHMAGLSTITPDRRSGR